MGGIGHRAVLVAAAILLLAPTQALADSGQRPGGSGHVLDRAGHGAAVLEALGDRLPGVAATNRMSTTRLQEILASDPTAWIGQDGRLFYVEPADQLIGPVGTVAGAATASYPESQTFQLHSLPGSAHTIFLDFNGATVSGTWWNAYGGMPARAYSGFTLDSDPTTFTSAEKAYIQTVWRIVAEKYSPFDVDVTTEDPGPAGYDRNGLLDSTYGDHVIITDDAGAVTSACGGGCSGIALLGMFDDASRTDDYYEPAWVFSSKTSHSAVLTAHAAAHEVGHTFGLSHDGDATHEYYSGHGNWFPIMGSSALGVGQFSKGEYAGANNTQDDLAIIAANGAPLRLDDHVDLLDTLLLADPLPTGSVADGVISTRTDKDVFAVDHNCTTNLTASAIGVGPGASLDMSVTVFRTDGTVVGTANPTSGQDTSVWPYVPTGMNASVTVPAGNALYYVRVDGVGKGDPATDGYSDYGSVGEYRLAISNCDGTMPATGTPATTTSTTTTTSGSRAPSAPRIGLASPGRRGGAVTATVRWAAPTSGRVAGYRIKARLLSSSGRVVKVITTPMISAAARGAKVHLPRGRYRFKVVAYNRIGASPASASSRLVRAR
ncbi:MAG TPA: zinc-dependent metalloprotease family protein [Marmoricola sp.]|nr:zinc-dependent metalloprotease family protein [Marmoricola sp.]